MRAWLDDPGHRSDRFGKWTYDLADYKVSADEVRERFVGYRERFGATTRPNAPVLPHLRNDSCRRSAVTHHEARAAKKICQINLIIILLVGRPGLAEQ